MRIRSSAAVLTTEKLIFVEDCLSSILASASSCLSPSIVKATLLGKEIEALVDSGASENFVDRKIVSQLNLRVEDPSSQIAMSSEGFAAKTLGKVNAALTTFGRDYQLQFGMDKLCSDVILGLSFLQRHREVSFLLGGKEAPIKISQQTLIDHFNVAAANISVPPLFEFLTPDCNPIATRSRQYSKTDQQFTVYQPKFAECWTKTLLSHLDLHGVLKSWL